MNITYKNVILSYLAKIVQYICELFHFSVSWFSIATTNFSYIRILAFLFIYRKQHIHVYHLTLVKQLNTTSGMIIMWRFRQFVDSISFIYVYKRQCQKVRTNILILPRMWFGGYYSQMKCNKILVFIYWPFYFCYTIDQTFCEKVITNEQWYLNLIDP
jgi:hypothetical protein